MRLNLGRAWPVDGGEHRDAAPGGSCATEFPFPLSDVHVLKTSIGRNRLGSLTKETS